MTFTFYRQIICLVSLCLLSNFAISANNKNKSTPKKSVPQKQASSVTSPRLGVQPAYKQNYLNTYPLGNTQNGSGEPLPTPNVIENILKTPSPEVVKPSSSSQRFTFRHGCSAVTISMANLTCAGDVKTSAGSIFASDNRYLFI